MPIETLTDLRAWIAADLERYDRGALATSVSSWLHPRLGYTIPGNVCGPGLELPHWGTLIISPAARVSVSVSVGDGARLGANCVVNETVAPGATIVGIPGRAV